jgi:signal transduction histidine kinase
MTRRQVRLRTSTVAPQRFELADSAASCARWIRAAAGGASATVRIAVPDASGRLRVVAGEGPHDASGRLRSSRRRTVFRTQRPVQLPIQGAIGLSLGIFPLTHDGDALGVVEVLGPTTMVQDRSDVLIALVGQSALALNSSRIRTEAERALAGMSALLRLASELLWARTSTEVVRLVVKACHDHLGVPVAGLFPDRDGWGWFLAESGGVGARRRAELRAALQTFHEEPGSRRLRLPSLRVRFRQITGSRHVVALRAGSSVLLFGDVPDEHDDFLKGITSLLDAVLPRMSGGEARASRDRSSEMGIAWTAHELKGPLLGARAALELATDENATGEEGRELLRRTRDELGQLSDLIDPLLRWSTGSELLKRRQTDLVEVTREAVASSSLGVAPDRVLFEAPDQLFVRADPQQLRSAIANVVRNALMYSPADSKVRIRVQYENRSARVVIRDRGAGVAPEERETVFDPFSRGRASGSTRSGSGLGLFIARRVLEAHGGSISLRPSKAGATFVLEMPAEGWQLSAS